jgi:hypothetical protein
MSRGALNLIAHFLSFPRRRESIVQTKTGTLRSEFPTRGREDGGESLPLKSNNLFHFLAVGFSFIGLFILYFSPILFSNSFIVSDGLIPADFKIHQWSNSIFSGYPLIADPIWGALNPIRNVVYKILHLDFNYFIISGYIVTAFFTYAYVYQLTQLKSAACISAIAFSFSGFAMFEIGHAATFIHTLCWMPLVLLAFEKLKTNNSPFWILIAALAIAMSISGGFPQIAVAMFVLFLAYVCLLGLQTKHKLKNTLFYLSILCSGYLLAAPIIFPTFILSLFSSRTHLAWEVFSSYYVELKQLLLFYFPYLMGGYRGIYAKTAVFGNWEIVGNHGYLGFLSTILAVIGLFKRVHTLKSLAYFWITVSLLSLLVALGPELSFFYKIVYSIPIVNNFRAPERYLFLFAFGISVLVGMGIQALQLGQIQNIRQKIIIGLGSLFFALGLLTTVLWLYPSLNGQALQRNHLPLPDFYKNAALVIPSLWIFLSLIGLFIVLRKPTSGKSILLITSILATELLYTGYFSYWHPNYSYWTKEQFFNPPTYLSQFKADLNHSKQRYLLMQTPWDTMSSYFFGDSPLYYHLPSAGGYSSLAIKKYTDFLSIAEYGSYLGIAEEFQNNQAINIAGIKYFITKASDPLNGIWFRNENQFKLKNKINNMIIYENLRAQPRVWFTSEVFSLSEEETLHVIHSGMMPDGARFNPAKVALSTLPLSIHFEQDPTATAIIEQLKDTQVIIRTRTQKPQFMILSDVYYPGWKVYLDKKKSNFYLTDYIYRGIVVPAGEHQVVFKFRPYYVYLSDAISGVTLLIILAYVASIIQRRRYY